MPVLAMTQFEHDTLRAVVQIGADGIPVRRAERIEAAVYGATARNGAMILDVSDGVLDEIRDSFRVGARDFAGDVGLVEAVAARLDVDLSSPGMSM